MKESGDRRPKNIWHGLADQYLEAMDDALPDAEPEVASPLTEEQEAEADRHARAAFARWGIQLPDDSRTK